MKTNNHLTTSINPTPRWSTHASSCKHQCWCRCLRRWFAPFGRVPEHDLKTRELGFSAMRVTFYRVSQKKKSAPKLLRLKFFYRRRGVKRQCPRPPVGGACGPAMNRVWEPRCRLLAGNPLQGRPPQALAHVGRPLQGRPHRQAWLTIQCPVRSTKGKNNMFPCAILDTNLYGIHQNRWIATNWLMQEIINSVERTTRRYKH